MKLSHILTLGSLILLGLGWLIFLAAMVTWGLEWVGAFLLFTGVIFIYLATLADELENRHKNKKMMNDFHNAATEYTQFIRQAHNKEMRKIQKAIDEASKAKGGGVT